MTKQLDLPHRYRQHLETLLRRHLPRVEVWAYGSRVNGQSHDGSDLDLVLRSPDLQQIPADSLTSFSEALRESTIPFLVEVHDWARLPESFHPEIEREHVVLVEGEDQSVIDNWQTVGEFSPLAYGKGLPERKRNPLGTFPVFGSNGVVGHHDMPLTSGPTIIVGRKGTVGAVHYSPVPCWPIDTTFFVTGDDAALQRYKYYALQSLGFEHMNADTAVPGLNRNDAHGRKVYVPPLPEQRTIAQILGSFDDKIELNRQLNETLEELARAIFKDWFVDFGPVRAKLEGRDTGLPEHLAELFPDRLVESELGEIPEGWEAKPVTALVSIVGGGTPKTSVDEYWGGDIPWFSVVDTPPPGSVYVVMTEKTITQKGLQESSARLVPEGTTIISARGTVGNLAMCGRPMAFNQSCYGLRPSSDVGDYFVFLTAHNLVDRLQAMAHGSVFSTITRQTIEAVSIATAPRAVHLAFEATLQPFFSRIKVNVEESRILSQLRDVLLPKLVSGKVRVDVGSV